MVWVLLFQPVLTLSVGTTGAECQNKFLMQTWKQLWRCFSGDILKLGWAHHSGAACREGLKMTWQYCGTLCQMCVVPWILSVASLSFTVGLFACGKCWHVCMHIFGENQYCLYPFGINQRQLAPGKNHVGKCSKLEWSLVNSCTKKNLQCLDILLILESARELLLQAVCVKAG